MWHSVVCNVFINESTVKIIGIHKSSNKNLENEENFKKHNINIKAVLNLYNYLTKEFNFGRKDNYFQNFGFIQNYSFGS